MSSESFGHLPNSFTSNVLVPDGLARIQNEGNSDELPVHPNDLQQHHKVRVIRAVVLVRVYVPLVSVVSDHNRKSLEHATQL